MDENFDLSSFSSSSSSSPSSANPFDSSLFETNPDQESLAMSAEIEFVDIDDDDLNLFLTDNGATLMPDVSFDDDDQNRSIAPGPCDTVIVDQLGS